MTTKSQYNTWKESIISQLRDKVREARREHCSIAELIIQTDNHDIEMNVSRRGSSDICIITRWRDGEEKGSLYRVQRDLDRAMPSYWDEDMEEAQDDFHEYMMHPELHH